MELLLASLAAYAASRVLADEGAQPSAPASPATAALTTLEQLAKQRATQQTKLFAMPPGDATVNPVGTGVAVALDRLPADHYTFAEGWYRART